MATNDDSVTVQCAWCGTILRKGGPTISHGICRDCAPVLLERIRERLGGERKPEKAESTTARLPRASGD